MKCSVVIPAAGSGSRFGSTIPKQFLLLRGRPILAHTVERFRSSGRVSRIILCADSAQRTRVDELISVNGWSEVVVADGGETRQESVLSGLELLEGDDESLIAVHDAVRPFFSRATFEGVLKAAEEFGAAVPVTPMVETVHRIEGRFIRGTTDRSELASAQTPQCFRLGILRAALQRAKADGISGTDDAGLVARCGHPVRIVDGDGFNMKITQPEDLYAAEANFDRWSELL